MQLNRRIGLWAGLGSLALAALVSWGGFAILHSAPATAPQTASHASPAKSPAKLSADNTGNIPQKVETKPAEKLLTSTSGLVSSQTAVHTLKGGESLTSLAHHYLSQTIYLTTDELKAAIQEANAQAGTHWRPGMDVVIPGYLSVPIVERAIPIAPDFEVRGIYLTGYMAGSAKGLELIRHWRQAGGNAVAFDIKDMDGLVNVPFEHALAPEQKGVPIRNLPKFVHYLHFQGLHAIARIALFRDQYLAEHHSGLAPQSRRSGRPWRENGKMVWADPSRPEVQQYNLALARAVVTSGVDEIQFDYVRFPAEGDQKDAQFAYQSAHPNWQRSDVISDFLARAYKELHPMGVLVSLDVFGVMAWQRPVDLAHTGQDIPALAHSCDILSPMIYPSHFFGMDGYKSPGDAPEHFIRESMDRFQKVTAGTKVVLRPWLQAFGWRTKTFSDAYIRTQVSVARKEGGIGCLFWNARNDYTKLFLAMGEMRGAPERFFRGDEIQASRTAPAPATAATPLPTATPAQPAEAAKPL